MATSAFNELILEQVLTFNTTKLTMQSGSSLAESIKKRNMPNRPNYPIQNGCFIFFLVFSDYQQSKKPNKINLLLPEILLMKKLLQFDWLRVISQQGKNLKLSQLGVNTVNFHSIIYVHQSR